MKNKCLKLFFGISLFFCLAFLSVPEVKAADVAFYEQLSGGVLIGGLSTPQGYGIKFTATNNSLSLVKIALAGYDSSLNHVYLKICEIPSLTTADTSGNTDCIDTPFLLSTVVSYLPSNGSSQYTDFVIETPYYTEPGHFYKLKVTNSANSILGDTVAGSHITGFATFQWNAGNLYNYYTTGYKLKTQLYYDDTLESWCGDTVCNGTETTATCAEDCGPPACTSISYMYMDNLMGLPDIQPSLFSSCSPDGIQYRSFWQDGYGNSITDGCNPATAGSVMPESRSCIYNQQGASNTIYDFTQTCYANYPCHYTFNYFADNDFTGTDIVKIYQCGDPITLGDTVNVSTCDTDKTLIDQTSFDVSMLNWPQALLTRTAILPNEALSADVIYEIQIYDPSDTTLKGDLKTSVRWLPHSSMPIYSATTTTLLTGTSNDRFGSAHTMACTATDWADTDWWTEFRCGTMEALLFIPYTLVDSLKEMIGGIADTLAVIFPFNIPTQVYKSWNDSAVATLPTEYNWLKIADSSGNVYISFPAALSGTATATPILVWGTDVFTPTGSTSAVIFGHIRSFSTLTLYLAFLYGLWAVGKRLLNEIGFINHEEKIRKRELQL